MHYRAVVLAYAVGLYLVALMQPAETGPAELEIGCFGEFLIQHPGQRGLYRLKLVI